MTMNKTKKLMKHTLNKERYRKGKDDEKRYFR